MKQLIGIIGLVFLQSCYSSYSVTDMTNEYQTEKEKVKKVLVIPPDFVSVKQRKDGKIKLMNETSGLSIINSTIKTGLKAIKLDYTLINETDPQNTGELFKFLVPLKKELLASSSLHENPIEASHFKDFTNKLFARSPKFNPCYSSLNEKYGTPYVLFVGIYTNESFHYQYTILADVNRSEIIYRNLKYIGQTAKKDNMEPVLFDTIYSLKHK